MVNKDELYAEILRQNIEIRELKEHLALVYVELSNSMKKVFLDDYSAGMPLDSQMKTD